LCDHNSSLWSRDGMPSLPAMTACQVHGGRGHTCLLPILTDGTSCCCDICPTRYIIDVYNTSYDIAHRCMCTRWWVRTEDDTTCRLCGTDTETVVHVVLHCPALATKVWPALLSFLAGLDLNRDDTDEGTLLLSLKLQNDSNAVATSLAFFRHDILVTTHPFTTNHCEGLGPHSALRQYIHREYLLAAVEGRQGSRQRTIFRRDGWPSLAELYPIWDAYQWIPWRHRRDAAQTTPCI